MITLDAVRAAVLAENPYTQMDELVRAEMAAGRKINDIFESLHPLTDDVLDTPSLSEDGEEAFLGTLDALTGMCHADCQYYDPPNTTLPTEEEVAKLPRWARVAFAARCARRVVLLYNHFWPDAPEQNIETLNWAVDVPETIAAHGRGHEHEAGQVAVATEELDRMAVAYGTACYSAAAVSFAADAAVYALLHEPSQEHRNAASAAVTAAEPITDITVIIRRDFDHLAELARWRYWTDDTPVPPEVFGPLWPEGPPQGWPADPDTPKHDDLPIDLFAREKASATMIEDDIVHLFKAMNAYHIARGGGPLTIEHLRPLLAALVPAEV